MTALMAGTPMALGYGAGAEARRSLGLAVVGGLLFSQTLTLYVTSVSGLLHMCGKNAAVAEKKRKAKVKMSSFKIRGFDPEYIRLYLSSFLIGADLSECR